MRRSSDLGGFWSAYWYNGYIYGSEIARGLDIFELKPSEFLSQNEIDAAKLIHVDLLNVQDQQRYTFPPSFAVPRAYLDQLARNNGLAGDRVAAARDALARAESANGAARAFRSHPARDGARWRREVGVRCGEGSHTRGVGA